jgi:hypothetical protein
MDCKNCNGYKCTKCTRNFPVGTTGGSEKNDDWFIW